MNRLHFSHGDTIYRFSINTYFNRKHANLADSLQLFIFTENDRIQQDTLCVYLRGTVSTTSFF